MDALKDPVLEEGPPCNSRMANGTLRIGAGGLAWGFFMGSYVATKEGYNGSGRALFVAKSIGKYGFLGGFVGGTYLGLNCVFERSRMKRDWVNATVAGAITGAVVAARTGNSLRIVGTSLALSALTTADYFISSAQDEPTEV